MSKGTGLITTLKFAEIMNSFFKSAFLVGKNVRRKERDELESNEDL